MTHVTLINEFTKEEMYIKFVSPYNLSFTTYIEQIDAQRPNRHWKIFESWET